MQNGVVSVTLTVSVPAGFAELANTGRAIPDREPTVRPVSESADELCWNEADTPGPGATLSVTTRSCAVMFCTVTTKARCFGSGNSGLASCGEPTRSPSLIRLR